MSIFGTPPTPIRKNDKFILKFRNECKNYFHAWMEYCKIKYNSVLSEKSSLEGKEFIIKYLFLS